MSTNPLPNSRIDDLLWRLQNDPENDYLRQMLELRVSRIPADHRKMVLDGAKLRIKNTIEKALQKDSSIRVGDVVQEVLSDTGYTRPDQRTFNPLAYKLGITNESPILYLGAKTLNDTHRGKGLLAEQFPHEKKVFPALLLTMAVRDYNLFGLVSEQGSEERDVSAPEDELEILSRLIRAESEKLQRELPKTAKALYTLSGMYAGDRRYLQTGIRQCFWDGILVGGVDEILTRDFARDLKRDPLEGADAFHVMTLGLARVEKAAQNPLTSGDELTICRSLVEYQFSCLYKKTKRVVSESRSLYDALREAIYNRT